MVVTTMVYLENSVYALKLQRVGDKIRLKFETTMRAIELPTINLSLEDAASLTGCMKNNTPFVFCTSQKGGIASRWEDEKFWIMYNSLTVVTIPPTREETAILVAILQILSGES